MEQKANQPFFARYLEGQEYPEVKTDLKAGISKRGRVFMTLKYPSDSEDNPPVITLKYPSDQEG